MRCWILFPAGESCVGRPGSYGGVACDALPSLILCQRHWLGRARIFESAAGHCESRAFQRDEAIFPYAVKPQFTEEDCFGQKMPSQ